MLSDFCRFDAHCESLIEVREMSATALGERVKHFVIANHGGVDFYTPVAELYEALEVEPYQGSLSAIRTSAANAGEIFLNIHYMRNLKHIVRFGDSPDYQSGVIVIKPTWWRLNFGNLPFAKGTVEREMKWLEKATESFLNGSYYEAVVTGSSVHGGREIFGGFTPEEALARAQKAYPDIRHKEASCVVVNFGQKIAG